MMLRIFPYPILSAVLAVSWMLLITEFSLAHALLALFLAWGIPRLCAPFVDHLSKIRSYPAALRLTLLVTWDIVVANVAVAKLVLGPIQKLRPAFLAVPLDTQSSQAQVLFASIITMTPGTVSADFSDDHKILYVHALDCEDPHAMIADMKSRYEQPLKEIFGC
jgi:multicomponent K+:H+ antiporter subunit E